MLRVRAAGMPWLLGRGLTGGAPAPLLHERPSHGIDDRAEHRCHRHNPPAWSRDEPARHRDGREAERRANHGHTPCHADGARRARGDLAPRAHRARRATDPRADFRRHGIRASRRECCRAPQCRVGGRIAPPQAHGRRERKEAAVGHHLRRVALTALLDDARGARRLAGASQARAERHPSEPHDQKAAPAPSGAKGDRSDHGGRDGTAGAKTALMPRGGHYDRREADREQSRGT